MIQTDFTTPSDSNNKKFTVKVDDNFHYMDENERYRNGEYATLEEAIKKCEEITVSSLKGLYEEGMDAEGLSAQWSLYGEDPFVMGAEGVPFSARRFVTGELCTRIIKEFKKVK